MRLHPLFALLVVSSMTLNGCGGGKADRLKVYKVSGTVKLQGIPLPGATVTFAPRGEKQRIAFAKSDDDGKYVLTTYDQGDGAAEGPYAVIVVKDIGGGAVTGPPSENDPNYGVSAHDAKGANTTNASGNVVPEVYTDSTTTPFNFTVKPSNDNVIDLEIK